MILLVFFSSAAFAESDSRTVLSVKRDTRLLRQPRESAEAVAQLAKGEQLSLLVNVLGSSASWHMVKTEGGVVGWIRSSDVEENQQLEKVFQEQAAMDIVSVERSLTPDPPFENAMTVPVEMDGSSIIVPVVLNRSVETTMIVDTGSTMTGVSSEIAERLGLKSSRRLVVTTLGGNLEVPLARLGSLKVGDAEAYHLLVLIQDFSRDPRVEGILGLDFLRRFHISIDSERRLLSLAPR